MKRQLSHKRKHRAKPSIDAGALTPFVLSIANHRELSVACCTGKLLVDARAATAVAGAFESNRKQTIIFITVRNSRAIQAVFGVTGGTVSEDPFKPSVILCSPIRTFEFGFRRATKLCPSLVMPVELAGGVGALSPPTTAIVSIANTVAAALLDAIWDKCPISRPYEPWTEGEINACAQLEQGTVVQGGKYVYCGDSGAAGGMGYAPPFHVEGMIDGVDSMGYVGGDGERAGIVSPASYWVWPVSPVGVGGFIFGCDDATMSECLGRGIVGLPAHMQSVIDGDGDDCVLPGTTVFLYNITRRMIFGIFEATTSE